MASTKLQIIIEAVNRTSKEFKSVQTSLEKLQPQFRRMATAGTIAFAGIAGGVGLAVREFSNFDDAMTKSLAIMGDVSDTMKNDMVQAARDVAKATTFSAKEAADSFFFLASAGLSAEQAIGALPQVAAFAQAGAFDMATATDLLTDAQSALGLTVDDTAENMINMARVSDVLVKANTLANATVQQFSEALTTEAGAAMKAFNIDIEEGIGVLAAYADQGVKGQVAGSGFARIIRLMTKAANNNQKEMDALGLSIFDTTGKIRPMADIIQNLEESLAGMSDQQKTASLEAIGFTARVQGIILPLLGTSDAIREYTEEAYKAGQITKEVADKQLESFKSQMSLLGSNIRDVMIEIGGVFIPMLKNLIDKIKPVTDQIANWVRENPELTKTIILVGLAVAGVTAALGFMGLALIPIMGALAFLLTPLGAVMALLIVTAGVMVKFRNQITATIKKVNEKNKVIERLRDAWGRIVKAYTNFLRPVLKQLGEEFKKLTGGAGIFEFAIELVVRIIEKVSRFVEGAIYIFGGFAALLGGFVQIINPIVNVFRLLGDMIGWVNDKIKAFWGWISGAESAVQSFSSEANMSFASVGDGAANMSEQLMSVATDADFVSSAVGDIGNEGNKTFPDLVSGAGSAGSAAKDLAEEYENVLEGIKDLRKEINDLEKDFTQEHEGFRTDFATAYVKQEELVADEKEKIEIKKADIEKHLQSQVSDSNWANHRDKLQQMQTELTELESSNQINIDLLAERKDTEIAFADEVAEVRRRNALTDFQRTWEDIHNRMKLANEEFATKMALIVEELKKQEEKRDEIIAMQTATAEHAIEQSNRVTQVVNANADSQIAKENELFRARQIAGSAFSIGLGSGGMSIPNMSTEMANGGIVTSPTHALIGEAGPEAVIPLSKSGVFGGTNIYITGTFLSETAAEEVGDMIVDKLKENVRI